MGLAPAATASALPSCARPERVKDPSPHGRSAARSSAGTAEDARLKPLRNDKEWISRREVLLFFPRARDSKKLVTKLQVVRLRHRVARPPFGDVDLLDNSSNKFLVVLILSLTTHSQVEPHANRQPAPERHASYAVEGKVTEPRLFAEGTISTVDDEIGGAFSPDGTGLQCCLLPPCRK